MPEQSLSVASRLRRCIPLLVVALVAIMTFAAPAGAASADAQITTQLPRNARPTHYDISLIPDAQTLSFTGRVDIALDILEPSSAITLNALDIAIHSARLEGAGLGVPLTPKISIDAATQTASFSFERTLAPGSYRLLIDYTGRIGTQANGLFAIDYDTAAGQKRALYTQFENSDARRVIPSWDEPAYKASFTLAATVPNGEVAVSNMPVAERSEVFDGHTLVRFETTPKMSTYLLFFGLGDFDRATTRVGPTEVGVITQTGAISQAGFALDSSAAVLREYNDYFAIPYPLPKLDNVASPGRSQFFSAMENWGAIFTFERAILLNPAFSTQTDRQGVFSIAAHEIAHQWFGNLVTMQWWDDLWLNEGFATWMADRTTTLLHPEWKTSLYAVGQRDGAIDRDAMATTHPVVQHVATVEQASQAFDAITYGKGAAVIRMLEAYVGADAWRAGVRQYLKAHAYGNTVSNDLWREIEKAASQPVTAIAHDFTLQPGVPLLRVGEPVCENGSTTLTLTQGEFSKDQPGKKPLRWRVPVIAQAQGSDPVRTVVVDGKAVITVPGCTPVIINAGQSGYYRTLYSPTHFRSIENAFASLATIDQLGVLGDAWSLGLNGEQPVSDVLDLAAATPVDADPQVWQTLAMVLDTLNDLYDGMGARQDHFRVFARAQLAPVLARIGWAARADEPDTIPVLRNSLIGTLGALEDPAVIAEARRRHAASAKDPAALPAPLRKTILGVVASHADAATWDQLHAQARNEKTALIKDFLYSLLASAEDVTLARRALDLALTAEPGATNTAQMISMVAARHPDLAYDFAIAHMAEVNQRVDASARSRYYPGLASRSVDPAMIGKIRSYADAHLAASSRRDAETAVARINYRIKVRAERLPAIDARLQRG